MEFNRIMETQKALMNNAPLKQQRLYQRLLEREKKALYREQNKPQKSSHARYNTTRKFNESAQLLNDQKQYTETSKVMKDIYSPEQDDGSSYSNRMGSSRRSKRSEMDSADANTLLKKGHPSSTMQVISESDHISFPKTSIRSPVTKKNTNQTRTQKASSKVNMNNTLLEDIPIYESVMHRVYDRGLVIKDIVSHIEKCRDH